MAGRTGSRYTSFVTAPLFRQRSLWMSPRLLSSAAALVWACIASTPETSLASECRSDRMIIMPGKGADKAVLAKFHSAHHASVVGRFSGIRGLEILSIPTDVAVERLVAEYQRSGLVEFAEPDYLGHTA